jgi:hypothetical protein
MTDNIFHKRMEPSGKRITLLQQRDPGAEPDITANLEGQHQKTGTAPSI